MNQPRKSPVRRFSNRPELPEATLASLREKTAEIVAIDDLALRRERARVIYNSSRPTDWFAPVIVALRGLCGAGELCMYCSSNEPSQVEHFKPLNVFPHESMTYENYLWSCDICNRSHKGERFPPDTEPGAQILNPLDDDVWEHFFIDDRFGRLIRRRDRTTKQPLPRAVSTCDVVGIDREIVQTKRIRRFRNLRRDAERAIADVKAGTLSVANLQREVEDWRSEPFQADVADYFLAGPGRNKEPFRTVFDLLATGAV